MPNVGKASMRVVVDPTDGEEWEVLDGLEARPDEMGALGVEQSSGGHQELAAAAAGMTVKLFGLLSG